jgi:nitrogen regulatory protein P-II 1
MKKVEAVIQGFKADEIREVLAKEKIPRVTIFEVKGAGSHQGKVRHYRGVQYIEDSADVKIEIVADDDEAERIAELIVNTLRTDSLGDGEVIIVPIDQNFRLRVGQHGHRVPNWNPIVGASHLMRNTTSIGSCLKALRRKFHEAG